MAMFFLNNDGRMYDDTLTTNLYKRHRFPVEIISPCIWLYVRFSLSYRDVEEFMAA